MTKKSSGVLDNAHYGILRTNMSLTRVLGPTPDKPGHNFLQDPYTCSTRGREVEQRVFGLQLEIRNGVPQES